jgi:hypothetical protein
MTEMQATPKHDYIMLIRELDKAPLVLMLDG